MTRSRVFTAAALLLATLFLGFAAASPCIPGCGTVTADPVVSSSTAQGESSFTTTQWEHCLETRDPYSLQCQTGEGALFASAIEGPSARCAAGTLTANGEVVARTLFICIE